MRFRSVWLTFAVIMAVLISYYAGYRHGLEKRSLIQPVEAAAPRERPPAPKVPLNSISDDDYKALMVRDLTMPLPEVKPAAISDTFNQSRGGGKRHEATDIMAPRNTPIYAIEDGTIRKLFLSKAGGTTIYEFDPQGIYCFYYAHLDHYADGLHEDMQVKKGEVIGYVGSTGDAAAEGPHLHFAIFKLGPDKKWWEGTPINPYPILVQLAARGTVSWNNSPSLSRHGTSINRPPQPSRR